LPKSRPAPAKKNGESQQGKETAVKELAAKVKRELAKEGQSADAVLKALLEGVEIQVTDEGLQIEFIEKHRTFFEIGSAAIRPDALKIVQGIGKVLAATGRPMIIDGHTDSRPLNNPSYNNWDLSTDRAASLRRALQSAGVLPKQFLQVRGNADRHLRVPGDPYSAENRRVTVMLPYKVGALPGDELAAARDAAFGKAVDLTPDAPRVKP
jgi:chemotaxis protein MotB